MAQEILAQKLVISSRINGGSLSGRTTSRASSLPSGPPTRDLGSTSKRTIQPNGFPMTTRRMTDADEDDAGVAPRSKEPICLG